MESQKCSSQSPVLAVAHQPFRLSGAVFSVIPMQLTTDDLGTPLAEVTFVVVDLETTGGSPREGGITEIGAVKVKAGELLGEFATLVNPGQALPPFIAALTGITDSMLAGAPKVAPVLASFLEFAAGATLVAHNAPYDIGFLKGACSKVDLTWPNPPVLDTARLARTALLRDEVPNCRLETLARHFATRVQPTHRALDDARATVEVFHSLLERLGGLGVQSLEDLRAFTGRVHPAQRAKRTLADGLPQAPGVYVFRDQQGSPLYIGTSTNIARRVRSYFTASETRRRMTEMVRIAARVDAITCATQLEAQVRETRLIAQEQPRYNRRGTRPGSQTWLRVTSQEQVEVSLVRSVRAPAPEQDVHYLGPWSSKGTAEPVRHALTWVLSQSSAVVSEFARLRPSRFSDLVWDRIQVLSTQAEYEAAGQWRDSLTEALLGLMRTARLQTLAQTEQIVAVRPHSIEGKPSGRWEAHCIRHGALSGAALLPQPFASVGWSSAVAALVACSAQVPQPVPGGLSACLGEAEAVARWLELPEVRLIEVSAPLAWPATLGDSRMGRLNDARQHLRSVSLASSTTRPLGPVPLGDSRVGSPRGVRHTRISYAPPPGAGGRPPDLAG